MAIKRGWGFAQNPFSNVNNGSYRMAVRISSYHIGAISAKAGDVFFDLLIKRFQPFSNQLQAAYSKWKASNGTQQGLTLQLTQQLQLLSTQKIKQWDIAIQSVYTNTTPQYKALLPNGRKPFQNGSQEDKINTVSALAQAIGDDAALANVKAEAQATYAELQATVGTQKGAIATTKTNSDEVEAARKDMCDEMFANLGLFIDKYSRAPEQIGQYFDLAAIRTGAQTIFTGDTSILMHENIMKRTHRAADIIVLKNEGTGDLQFYLAALKADKPGDRFVTVAAGTEKAVAAEELGNILNKFMNVYNPGETTEGSWTVELS